MNWGTGVFWVTRKPEGAGKTDLALFVMLEEVIDFCNDDHVILVI